MGIRVSGYSPQGGRDAPLWGESRFVKAVLVALIVLSAVAPVALRAPPGPGPGGCPNENALTNFQASLVAAPEWTIDGLTIEFSTDTTDRDPVDAVPGIIAYCVYPIGSTASGVDASYVGAMGPWDETAANDGSYFGFTRTQGNPNNLPLDGTQDVVVGSASFGSLPAEMTILFHINDAEECDDLYGSNPGTCFVFPTAPPPPPVNEAPTACFTFIPSATVFEGDTVTLDASCSSDPDGVIASYSWDLDITQDWNGDSIPDNDVDATGQVVTFVWHDDYASTVRLLIIDDLGATDTATGTVTALNLPPSSPTGILATFSFELGCRLAGSKWSNIECRVYEDYGTLSETLLGAVEIERWPGSPDSNPYSGGSVFLPIAASLDEDSLLTVVVTYDPYPDLGDLILGDQGNNGKDPFENAGNPAWVIQRFADGTECKAHHTFNTQQSMIRDSDHWNHVEAWTVELSAEPVAGAPLMFAAAATDPGTDDVTFSWDFGDGSLPSVTTYLWDGAGADPVMTPYEPYGAPYDGSGRTGTVPVGLVDTQSHTYSTPGSFTVILTVSDDDGGFSQYFFDITVGTGSLCG